MLTQNVLRLINKIFISQIKTLLLIHQQQKKQLCMKPNTGFLVIFFVNIITD